MPFVISKDPIKVDPGTENDSGFTIGGEVTPEGSPIYDADDILTKAGWRYRKKTTDTDMVQGAIEAAKGLLRGFTKIPDLVRSKGVLGAANNIPEGLIASGQEWVDIVKSAASKNYAVVTGMSEEQDLDRQYDNYRELAERSVEQVKRSRSRVGDFFRAVGLPEQAVPYDESVDQETSDFLSLVLDPTNLIGGGSLKALLRAAKGAKVAAAGGKAAVAGEKAAVAGEKAIQAAEKVSEEVAEKTAKGLPPIGDGPAPINFIEAPSAAVIGDVGKGAENVGKFGTSVGEKLADWQKANPLAAPIASAALAGYGSDWDPLAIIGGAVAPSAIKASATKLKLAGEAAQVAAVASREGIDVAAKSGIAGEKVSAIAKRLDTPAVNFLLSQSAQLADAVGRGAVIGGGLGYAVNNDPEQSGVGSGIGAGIVGGGMGRFQSIGIDQAGRVAFHRPDADGKWVRVSESPAALAKDQDLAVSFLASRSLPERTVLAGRLNIAELAELARGEAAAKGANRVTGSDMEVRFLDADGMVAAGFDPTVAKVMQGVTETDQKPTLYVNLDVATDPAYTLWHEGMHGFDRLAPDEVGGKQTDAGAALERTRAELKAFYFGSYDASGKQTSPGKYDGAQFLKLEDQYLSRVGMSEAELDAHMKQSMSKRVAYIADEMAAEHAGMLGRLSGGDIGKASRYPSTALGRAALGVLARTRIGLESLGIVFDGGGDVVTSGIFKDPTTGKRLELSSDVREKLAAYLRAKDKITTRMSIDFDESPITEVVNARDLAKASTTPETLARWKNSGMFALDDKGEIRMMGGKPVFLTAAERKKVDANRSLAIFTAIKAVPDDGSPGLRSEVIDGVETFKGTKLSKAQVDAVLALPDAVLPPSVKARISELVKLQEVPGGPVFADYNKAITGGRYDSKASISTQIFVPMSLSISAAGNFLVSSFSVVGYERKVAMWKKTKKKFFEPWDGNMDSFHNDVRTYLNNQESGAGNVAVGKEAITKKNAINDFLASVLVGDMNRVSTKSNSDNLIRSFRVDRMQSIERAGGDNMPYDYGKVRANFMPADDEAVMGGQARSQPADELSPEKLASLQSAKQYHGITRNISEAGYALPDGSLLDFSGRHQMQDSYEMRGGSWVPKDGKKDWQAGSRNVDHREIQFDGPQPDATSGGDMMVAYQKLGAMRVDATSSLVDMEVRPTSAQESVIRRIAEQNGGNITVDLQDGNRKSGLFYEGAKPQKVLGDIRRFYSGEDLKSGARFQPSDTDYLAAVKAGDMKVVQGMVDEAAKGAGYGIKAWHGSISGKIPAVFDKRDVAFFSGERETALVYSGEGGAVGEFRIALKKPLNAETPKDILRHLPKELQERHSSARYSWEVLKDKDLPDLYEDRDVIEALRDKGFDGAIIHDDVVTVNGRLQRHNTPSVAVFDPSQIKSADPITRDAQGNVIPLSKRFNTTSEDIRYQPAETPSEVSDAYDSLRVGTAKLGTKAKPVETPSSSNIAGNKVPAALLAEQMEVVNYPHLPSEILTEKDPVVKRRKFIDFQVANLLALYDAFPESLRARATLWYDGANRLAKETAQAFGYTAHQVAGVMAALSPQKDWFMNVAQARQLIEIWNKHQDVNLDAALIKAQVDDIVAGTIVADGNKKKAQEGETPRAKKKRNDYNAQLDVDVKAKRLEILSKMYGKSIRQLGSDPDTQAWAIRTLAQTIYGRDYRNLSPEGDFLGYAMAETGERKKNGWGSMSEIKKCVRILEDGSVQNISNNLGIKHKVRNFYNNIIAPNSPYGDATIDTHHVAAANLMPYGSSAEAVAHNFGSGVAGSDALGISGTYHLYLDAIREAAALRGLQPRQMQSITWEAIRLIWPSKTRRDAKVVADALNKWKTLSNEDARTQLTRSIPDPVWARTGNGGEPGGVPAILPEKQRLDNDAGGGLSAGDRPSPKRISGAVNEDVLDAVKVLLQRIAEAR